MDKLHSRLICIGPTNGDESPQDWYKVVHIPMVTKQKAQEDDFSLAGKEKLKQIIAKASVAQFKNDCGDIGANYIFTPLNVGVHLPVRQYLYIYII